MRTLLLRPRSDLPTDRTRALMALLVLALVASTLVVVRSQPAHAQDCPGPGGGSLPTLDSPSSDPDMVTFRGRGWGHGVGMSQFGAQGAAKLGCTASEILRTYYRDTAIADWDTAKRIRVSLDATARVADVAAGGSSLMWQRCESTNTGCQNIELQPANTTWRVRTTEDGLAINRNDGSAHIHVNNRPQVRVLLNGKVADITAQRLKDGSLVTTSEGSYKYGYFEFHRRWAAAAFATLELPLEPYLYGIQEIPWSWHDEALKSQAIAARTYGLRRVNAGTSGTCRCHVYATTSSQVYNGYDAEGRSGFGNWKQAVDDTFGKVVESGSTLADTVYSSSSGGYTASSEFVWGTSHPYLQAVDDSRWEQESGNPLSEWSVTVSRVWLGSKLNIGKVTRASVTDPTGPGSPPRVGDPAKDYGGVTFTGTTTGSSRYPGCSTPSNRTTTCSGDAVRGLLQSISGVRASTMFTVDYRYRQVPWDSVVFGDFDSNGRDEMLLYDRETGETLVYRIDQSGNPGNVLNRYWLAVGWDQIIAGDYDGDGDDELSFYRSSSGTFATYAATSSGGVGSRLYKAGLLPGWTSIFSGDHSGDGRDQLTFYRASSGRYASYKVHSDSSLDHRTYRANLLKSWSSVFAGDFNNGRDQVTFYRSSDGRFASYVTRADGSLSRRTYRANLLKNWTSVEAGDHGRSDGDLVTFYRTSDGRIASYATTSDGGLRTRTHLGDI